MAPSLAMSARPARLAGQALGITSTVPVVSSPAGSYRASTIPFLVMELDDPQRPRHRALGEQPLPHPDRHGERPQSVPVDQTGAHQRLDQPAAPPDLEIGTVALLERRDALRRRLRSGVRDPRAATDYSARRRTSSRRRIVSRRRVRRHGPARTRTRSRRSACRGAGRWGGPSSLPSPGRRPVPREGGRPATVGEATLLVLVVGPPGACITPSSDSIVITCSFLMPGLLPESASPRTPRSPAPGTHRHSARALDEPLRSPIVLP